MDLTDDQNFIGLTAGNPTVMQSFCSKFQDKFYWVLVSSLRCRQTFPCFLHGINTIISEICSYPFMKKVVASVTRIVTFFNSSHYWGGQRKEMVKTQGITTSLKQNCKSRWYALTLMTLSVLQHR
ncbi:hypothetical protein OBBRIDRAFT_730789 [Obba rivulosa]|uniref:Uncharacterized protein n=1 Tax=Obba rivulosa TaxID=1052685 RepID=A0A8E2B1C4_9APHY|nr:hypothetical protein OBBRIDRAFT_730789 [Obba rivulosa]